MASGTGLPVITSYRYPRLMQVDSCNEALIVLKVSTIRTLNVAALIQLEGSTNISVSFSERERERERERESYRY